MAEKKKKKKRLLFKLKNHFFLGQYSKAISECASVDTSSPDVEREVRYYEYLSRINMGEYDFVLDEIKGNEKDVLFHSIKSFVSYLTSKDEEEKKSIVSKFSNWLVDPILQSDSLFLVLASLLFAHAGNLKKAMQCVHKGETEETLYCLVILLIKASRLDLAEKTIKKMSGFGTLTQLAEIAVNMARGKPKHWMEGERGCSHLTEKFGGTSAILNLSAIHYLKDMDFHEAEKKLLGGQSSDPKDIQTKLNMYVCQKNLKKPDKAVDRYFNELKRENNEWYKDYVAKEKEFDKLCSSMQ